MENLNIPTLNNATVLPNMADVTSYNAEQRISFVRPYLAATVAQEGFRLAVIRWRNTDKATTQKASQMVLIPALKLPEEYALIGEQAVKVIAGVYEDEQDAIIRSKIDQGMSNIGWNDVALEAVLNSLTAVRISQRLTKEQIEAWFVAACTAVCNARATEIATGKGITDATEIAKMQAGVLNAYKALAMKLAAPVPNLGQNEATALEGLLKRANLADDMVKVLLNKLNTILRPAVLENGYL